MRKHLLGALIGAIAISGCANTNQKPTVVVERTLIFEEDNRRYIHSVATTEYGNHGLGGAAVRQPATIHVLADERRTADPSELSGEADLESQANKTQMDEFKAMVDELSSASGEDRETAEHIARAMAALASIQSSDPTIHLSHYDLTLWKRYCDHGAGMTENDWGQMLSSSLEQMPSELRASCQEPNLELTEELKKSFCSGDELSNQELYIVKRNEDQISCSP